MKTFIAIMVGAFVFYIAYKVLVFLLPHLVNFVLLTFVGVLVWKVIVGVTKYEDRSQ